jgi:hypothetical protein
MAEDVLKIPGELDLDKKRAAVEHRRCILLALLACTSPNNPTLKKLLSNGLLVTVKAWLDDILSGAIGTLSLLSLEVSGKPSPLSSHIACATSISRFTGSVDLLLHLLSSIKDLPVTKSNVVDSDMGKAIRDIEKHKICAGTANETAIKSRVKEVKDAWNASVKVNKVGSMPISMNSVQHQSYLTLSSHHCYTTQQDDRKKKKRPPQSSAEQSPQKKKKVESSFSSLVKKVSKSDDSKPAAVPASAPLNGSAKDDNRDSAKTSNGDKNSVERKGGYIL